MAKKKKSDTPKASNTPSIEAVSRRADELGMTYGLYVQSPQYIIDTADDGYFNRKRGKKNADKALA